MSYLYEGNELTLSSYLSRSFDNTEKKGPKNCYYKLETFYNFKKNVGFDHFNLNKQRKAQVIKTLSTSFNTIQQKRIKVIKPAPTRQQCQIVKYKKMLTRKRMKTANSSKKQRNLIDIQEFVNEQPLKFNRKMQIQLIKLGENKLLEYIPKQKDQPIRLNVRNKRWKAYGREVNRIRNQQNYSIH